MSSSPPAEGLAAAAPDRAAGPPAAAAAEPEARPAWRTAALRLAVVAGLVVLDLWSKSAVFAWLGGSDALLPDDCGRGHLRYHVLGEDVGWFTFMLSRNPGAAWGMLRDWPWALVAGRCLAALFLTWLVVRTPGSRRWFALALMLVLAGAVGNLYDNLFLPRFGDEPFGRVRDFIDVYFDVWKWHFPTFNVADSCITVGAVLLLITGFAREHPAAPAAAAAPDAPRTTPAA